MRIDELTSDRIDVVLSERNLRALLAKLSQPDSSCTIFLDDDVSGMRVVVMAENDVEHYANRNPGRMHPDTEALMELLNVYTEDDDGA